MHRRTLILAPVALGLAGCTAGPSATPLTASERSGLRIGAVQVITTGTVFDGMGAEEARNFLRPDLEGELRQSFGDRLAAQGWLLQAEIARLTVVGGTATAFGRDQSTLEGVVRLVRPDGVVRATIPVTVTAGRARESLGGRVVGSVAGGRDRFYRRLLDRFADDARELALGRDLPGERLVRAVTGG